MAGASEEVKVEMEKQLVPPKEEESQDVAAMPEVDIMKENNASEIFLNLFAKLVVPIFVVAILCVIGFWVTGWATGLKDLVYGILPLHLAIALFGAWAYFQYGVIQDQINELKRQNGVYKTEINGLKGSRVQLQEEVKKMNSTVMDLQKDASVLDEQTRAFDPLLEELKEIAGDSEEINRIIEETNSMFNDMKQSVLQNERAALLSTFYDCAYLRGQDNMMDKGEYKRFLGRLSPEQRRKFEEQGSFEEIAGDDELIDIDEFQALLEVILKDVEDMLREHMESDN